MLILESVGFFSFFACAIWLVSAAVGRNKRAMGKALTCVLIFLILCTVGCIGIFCS